MKFSILVVLVALSCLTAAVEAAEPLFLTQEEQDWLRDHPAPLRVHNEMAWKPYNYNEDGVPKGYSIDYMNLLAQKLGITVQYISGPSWEEFLHKMQDGSLDVMLNIANTRDRRRYLRFTDPYHITNVSLYVKSTENHISDLEDLMGRRLAFTEGFFFGEFIRRYYPTIKIATFSSTQASFVGVQQGLADATMDVPLVARSILRDMKMTDIKFAGKVSDPVFITTFSLATRKEDVILSAILQKASDSVTTEEMLAINEKWALKEEQAIQLSPEDVDYLQRRGALRLCVHPDRLPLEALNLDASLTGISSEFVERLSQLTQTPPEIVATRDWAESLRFAQDRKCDILPMIAKTLESRESLNFTSPWLTLEQVVATRNDQIYISDIDQLKERPLGVIRGQDAKENLLTTHPDLNLVEVDSVLDGLMKVSAGELFGFIDTLATISRVLRTEDIDNVKVSGTVGIKTSYAIGVRNDDGRLLNILEHAIGAIDPADINAIYNRWLAVAYVERVDYSRLWLALLVFGLLSAYAYYHYRRGLRTAAILRAAHAEVEAANKELVRLARTDSLTGLANRLDTDDVLRHEFSRFERYQNVFSIIMIDLDHFKKINDQHGHAIGDQVLKHIANTLEHKTRENDLVGRWGGEEFIVICPSTTAEGVLKLAESLKSEIENDAMEGLERQSASFGVATIHPNESINDLMRRADDALYRAKAAGRNRIEMAD